jgi:hypothetical protein
MRVSLASETYADPLGFHFVAKPCSRTLITPPNPRLSSDSGKRAGGKAHEGTPRRARSYGFAGFCEAKGYQVDPNVGMGQFSTVCRIL